MAEGYFHAIITLQCSRWEQRRQFTFFAESQQVVLFVPSGFNPNNPSTTEEFSFTPITDEIRPSPADDEHPDSSDASDVTKYIISVILVDDAPFLCVLQERGEENTFSLTRKLEFQEEQGKDSKRWTMSVSVFPQFRLYATKTSQRVAKKAFEAMRVLDNPTTEDCSEGIALLETPTPEQERTATEKVGDWLQHRHS